MISLAPAVPTFKPHFVGELVTRWLRHDGEDRLMQLVQDFTFVQSPELSWTAPAGFIFDGTSIPRALWSVFGDPFIGDYRRAAVFHDLLCTPFCPHCRVLMVDRGREATPRFVCVKHPGVRPHYSVSSEVAAHTMYVAMRTDGVTHRRATVITRAVLAWGPRFEGVSDGPAAAIAARDIKPAAWARKRSSRRRARRRGRTRRRAI